MSTAPHRTLGRNRLTYEDYLELPDDGRKYEILDGELAVTPPPTTTHQRVSAALEHALYAYVRAHGLGTVLYAPVGVNLANDCIVEPDIVFVAKSNEEIIKKHAIEGPPDLVIEILSRGTARRDRTTKATLYARFGVAHYWLVDPEARTLETYEKGKRRYRRTGLYGSDAILQPSLFPELRLDLNEIWV